MKHTLRVLSLTLFVTLITGCGTTNTKPNNTTPNVTLSPCLLQAQQATNPIKAGYGEGTNLQQAKQQAYNDIAEQFGVDVQTSNTNIQQKIDQQVRTQFTANTRTQASARLEDLQISCLQRHQGLITLALTYDTRPLHQQISDSLIEHWLSQPAQLTLQGPTPLTQSTLMHDVKQELLGNDNEQSLKLTLERKNGWSIRLNTNNASFNKTDNAKNNTWNKRWPLRNEQLHYVVNWSALNKGNLELTVKDDQGRPIPQKIYAGTEFRLHLNHTGTNTNNSYLHAIGIYEDGSLDIIRQNIKNKNTFKKQIPEQGIFEAGTLRGQKQSTDIYIAFITEKPLQDYGKLAQLLLGNLEGSDINHLLTSLEKNALAVGVFALGVME
ncbi:MAG: LPP20 family lipoprotein [Cellvibrionaceae bacterium]